MKRSFAPRARLMSILGEQLIKDDVVGLLELVKNGYDADATRVVVSVLHVDDPDRTEIQIQDNGTGMSLGIIEDHWLQPASGHKENAKRNNQRSRLGRLPQGEKGVGRFSAQRLGKFLTLVTREGTSEQEIVISIDWQQFDDENKSLSDVSFDVTVRKPEVFAEASGTLLKISGIRDPWDKRSLKRINRYLERMMSPFEVADDFHVQLVCPDYPELQNLNPSRITDYAHFQLVGSVDESGVFRFDYNSTIPGFEPRQLNGGIVSLAKPTDRHSLRCGPFSIRIFGWYRTPEVLGRTPEVSRSELDERSGIHVFRDGIRVLPYGEPGDDWLELDQRRINRPAERLGNKNLIGFVELRQDANLNLRDKTNREGFVENQAFRDLKSLTQQCVQELENLFLADRENLKTEAKSSREAKERSLKEKSNRLKMKLEDSSHSDSDRKKQEDAGGGSPPQQDLKQEMLSFVDDTEELWREKTEEAENERQLLLGLASLGLSAERFAHEFQRLVRKAQDRFERIEKRLGKHDLNVLAVKSAIEALANEIQGLRPLLSYQRRDRKREAPVTSAIDTAILLNSDYAADSGVHITYSSISDDFAVQMPSGVLVQVLNNLLDNAIHWASPQTPGQSGNIQISVLGHEGFILVEDDGPGIDPHLGDSIFTPFVTRRAEGHGLGLYICRQLLQHEGCEIRVLPGDSNVKRLTGAAFIVDLGNAMVRSKAASTQ